MRSIYLKKIFNFKRNSLYALLCVEILDLNHLMDKNINLSLILVISPVFTMNFINYFNYVLSQNLLFINVCVVIEKDEIFLHIINLKALFLNIG
jgi:hypothetical protein